MGRLTTHVLDTASGRPGAGIEVRLYSTGSDRRLVATARTNADGRTDGPLLEGAALGSGTYELEFLVGPYFEDSGAELSDPPFLDTVVIRVGLEAGRHYHVPLLVSPWGYTTYRGS
ncbi:MAG: hydroxyisourate hydrolase [Gammaproteobacteria bacterium]|nr:hydroxyisourate hydrolase [Gammaproteobacteria bacterium]MDH4255992.1 hydroxyisourate hydrolase [Gammaproteobacteria bacterium]MDH5309245.1 hydroxyisourate hydrolase [Gammaproteobacteria bacterium]